MERAKNSSATATPASAVSQSKTCSLSSATPASAVSQSETCSLSGATPASAISQSETCPSALELALAQLAADRLKINVDDIKITLSPQNASKKILPFIAWQEHVDVWKDDYTEGQKKEIIRTARKVHAQKGTIGALKLALNNLSIGAELEEWFDYGADPHYFRIHIRPEEGLDQEAYGHLFELIEETKNLRSILDKVIAYFTVDGQCYFGGAPSVHDHIHLYPSHLKDKNLHSFVGLGGGSSQSQQIIIQPKKLDNQQLGGHVFMGGGLTIQEHIYV